MTGWGLTLNSAGVSQAMTSPWKSRAMRSAISKADLRSWVMVMVVTPSSCLRSRITRPMTSVLTGSRPVVGSSKSRILGLRAMARAKPTRRFMPPDSSAGFSLSVPFMPTIVRHSSTRAWTSASVISRCRRRPKATFSNTVMESKRAAIWKHMPMLWRTSNSSFRFSWAMILPSMATCPESGVSRPMILRRSTVLPVPEPPRTTRLSPSWTWRFTLDSTTFGPKALERLTTSIRAMPSHQQKLGQEKVGDEDPQAAGHHAAGGGIAHAFGTAAGALALPTAHKRDDHPEHQAFDEGNADITEGQQLVELVAVDEGTLAFHTHQDQVTAPEP